VAGSEIFATITPYLSELKDYMDRRNFLKASTSLIAANTFAPPVTEAETSLAGKEMPPKIPSHTGQLGIELTPDKQTLWRLTLRGSSVVQDFTAPRIQVDGKLIELYPSHRLSLGIPVKLSNDVLEYTAEGAIASLPQLSIRLEFQLHPESSVVRFRYVLLSTGSVKLSRANGHDDFNYFSTSFKSYNDAREVQFSQFLEQTHCYQLSEVPVFPSAWTQQAELMGPALVVTSANASTLLAYEHGSEIPDAFLHFKLSPARQVTLRAAKGNYLDGQTIDAQHSYSTLYMHAALVAGDVDHLASKYRQFILSYQSQNPAARRPRICYNTWQFQTINKAKTGGGYLDSMNEDRILKEIEVAHRLGIDTFVIDTGWYDRTGDWRVNTKRFSTNMEKVRKELDSRGMELGLWFGPTTVGISSSIAREHPEWRMSRAGKYLPAAPVWETEDSYKMCLVSDYSDAFAEELIRLAKETGMKNIKWDAVGQYGCDDPHHSHGTTANSAAERADSYAFQLVQKMCYIADKVAAAAPGTFVDFDVTERNRAMGLGFLASGRYSLMNSGPYTTNYDMTIPGGVFTHQGQARTWITRSPLTMDRWLPSVSFLTHYLPGDPLQWQELSVASLILGQNGLWGDLPAISEGGIAYIGKALATYKTVRNDITESDPVVTGLVSGSPEIHEKISAKSGRGVVCIFTTKRGEFTYFTKNKVASPSSSPNVKVMMTENGTAEIRASFDRPGAAIIFFGAA
jgi:alpha-galactosidase